MLAATIHGSRGGPTPRRELLVHRHKGVFEIDHRPQPLLSSPPSDVTSPGSSRPTMAVPPPWILSRAISRGWVGPTAVDDTS